MTYRRDGDRLTMEMTVEDWDRLLVMLGYSLGCSVTRSALHPKILRCSRSWIQFVNELNRTNPDFTPYEIPKEFAKGEKP